MKYLILLIFLMGCVTTSNRDQKECIAEYGFMGDIDPWDGLDDDIDRFCQCKISIKNHKSKDPDVRARIILKCLRSLYEK